MLINAAGFLLEGCRRQGLIAGDGDESLGTSVPCDNHNPFFERLESIHHFQIIALALL